VTRARRPDRTGVVARPGGVRVPWEQFGTGEPAIVFVPTWSIVHSRVWKLQVADFARRHRVVTFDPRGNGGSTRPSDAAAYDETAFADDILAVMDATGTERAVLVSLSLGAQRSLIVAARHPERVEGAVFIGPSLPLAPRRADRAVIARFDEALETDEGWAKYNSHYWRRDYPGFLEYFFGQCFSEPHSTKPIEDCVGWGSEIDPESLILSHRSAGLRREEAEELAAAVRCPVLVIHGDDDRIVSWEVGRRLAELTGGRLLTIAGGGHIPLARDPVVVNLAIRDFVASLGARLPVGESPATRPSRPRTIGVRRASPAA
jgi:pimeloyl-ACP methyl ester carboxylesterase